MTSAELRTRFLKFFRERGHAILPSASLVPENDPTTLFTGSGMQPLIPYLLGQSHPQGKRLANVQPCVRTNDIDEVGDNRHTTFFEMLGNWSLGDYWKKEQLTWFFQFLTEEVGIPKEKLWVTCFEGDTSLDIPPDHESAEIWKQLGIPEERIRFYGAEKNWWSRSGPPSNMPVGEPGGPDSEVFYEFTSVTHNPKFGETCHPNCACGRFMEIGNSVFMEYKKTSSGFDKLAQRNVDFGGGLERITAALADDPDVFAIDLFKNMIATLEKQSSASYQDSEKKASFRIVADHIRAAVFLIADGVKPGKEERSYISRRLIRDATTAYSLFIEKKLNKDFFIEPVNAVVELCKKTYPILSERREEIISTINDEIEEYSKVFVQVQNIKDLQKLYNSFNPESKWLDDSSQNKKLELEGRTLFRIRETKGVSWTQIKMIIQGAGFTLDDKVQREYDEAYYKHQDLSRAGAAQKFAGGMANHSEKTVRLHTAHHLLLRVLQIVLGPDVHQRGSNITQERLRIDFSHKQKMTEEQKHEVERIVSEKIVEDLPVIRSEMTKEEAEQLNAEREFGQKYPDQVSVYSIGPKGASPGNPQFSHAFSIEICGGPHVARTGVIGQFRITKEEGLSAGIRRIRAVAE